MAAPTLTEIELKRGVGQCSWNLLYCHKCSVTLASSFEKPFSDKNWCVKLLCRQCNECWYVCNSCSTLRNRMTKTSQIKRHHTSYHSTTQEIMKPPPKMDVCSANKMPPHAEIKNKEAYNVLGNHHSIEYFLQESVGNGRKSLVAKAVGI